MGLNERISGEPCIFCFLFSFLFWTLGTNNRRLYSFFFFQRKNDVSYIAWQVIQAVISRWILNDWFRHPCGQLWWVYSESRFTCILVISKSSCLFCAKNMYTMFKHRVKYCILQSQWLLETTKETKTTLAIIFMKVI